MLQHSVCETEVALAVFKVDWVDLVRHRAAANLASNGLLPVVVWFCLCVVVEFGGKIYTGVQCATGVRGALRSESWAVEGGLTCQIG